MPLEIKGTITRNGITTEFSINPSLSSEGGWQQWGGTNDELWPNAELLSAMSDAARDDLNATDDEELPEHELTEDSQIEFDLDAEADLECICGYAGNSDELLDHIVNEQIARDS